MFDVYFDILPNLVYYPVGSSETVSGNSQTETYLSSSSEAVEDLNVKSTMKTTLAHIFATPRLRLQDFVGSSL